MLSTTHTYTSLTQQRQCVQTSPLPSFHIFSVADKPNCKKRTPNIFFSNTGEHSTLKPKLLTKKTFSISQNYSISLTIMEHAKPKGPAWFSSCPPWLPVALALVRKAYKRTCLWAWKPSELKEVDQSGSIIKPWPDFETVWTLPAPLHANQPCPPVTAAASPAQSSRCQ